MDIEDVVMGFFQLYFDSSKCIGRMTWMKSVLKMTLSPGKWQKYLNTLGRVDACRVGHGSF